MPEAENEAGKVPCKICDRGELFFKRIFRSTSGIVFFANLLWVPAVLGMVYSVILARPFVSALIFDPNATTSAEFLSGAAAFQTLFYSIVLLILRALLMMQKAVLLCDYSGATVAPLWKPKDLKLARDLGLDPIQALFSPRLAESSF